MALALVLPTYNFTNGVTKTFALLSAWRSKKAPDIQVYFVDDGSTDDTLAALRDFAAANQAWCHVVALGRNMGKGAAVRAGFLAAAQAGASHVVFTDCDLHYGLDIILERVLPELVHHDIVLLDRTWDDSSLHSRKRRRLASALFSKIVGTLTGITYCDTQAGLKGFRVDTCLPVFELQRINGFAFDVELLSLALYYRLCTIQVPVRFSESYPFPETSTVRLFRTSMAMLVELLRINFNWKLGRYDSPKLEARVQARQFRIGA